jgi:transcription elongation GreA/GreB family factor
MNKKEKYIALSLAIINRKRKQLKDELQELQVAMASETKSSAGDKYETAREMINQEKNKILTQLSEIAKQENFLSQINPSENDKVIRIGSIVSTSKAVYFISISLGEIADNGVQFMAISPASPIGQLLLNKKAGDTIEWRGKSETILSIE